MAALLRPQKGLGRQEFRRTRNRFGQRIVAFVVIDAEAGSDEAVIGLDDAGHDAGKDRERAALLAPGHYGVTRIPSRPRPTEASVREATSSLRAPQGRAPRGSRVVA
ncbi:hypothetical protein OPKNFCMD_5310 [Methylobacterium crusticola]|uniref:DUF2726 domain-containing protein n=1 Tax=Methylobacterium crusticola TaxID=1697972 RepID=A0ABQ4R5M5_9HYPH|nr:DUF2726 domain-containing protein [Methylobacterium crusticola]GJD52544.1 hypothetical protein OPKNFCMD_5310 [Methylobacterium crusticola]